jgi:lipid-binding SYLF domain-containing protein
MSMITRSQCRNAIVFVAAAAVAWAVAAVPASAASKQQKIVDDARYVAERFAGDASLEWVHDNMGRAKGVFIVPQQVKAGFIFGGSNGSGVLLARDAKSGTWSYPAFYTMSSATIGFQIGGQVAEIVLLIMTDKGMDALRSSDFKLGGDVSIAAGPVGVGAKAATADVVAFSRTKGLYGGLNLEGAVVSTRREWNDNYYGRTVSPSDILFNRAASNPSADALRRAVASMGR